MVPVTVTLPEASSVSAVLTPALLCILLLSCWAQASQCMLTVSSTVVNPLTWEATTSGIGSPSAAGKGDNTFATLFVFLVILVQIACGSTTPFIVT
nr:hypothetical protein Iba_chr02dCG7060 [Ipomoea batatas]